MPCNTSMVLLNKGRPVLNMNKRICAVFKVCSSSSPVTVTGQGHGQEPTPVIMVDELLILSPHKLSFSEAGLRIMITPHFPPRTRLSMAGRMVISEVCNTRHRRHNTQQTDQHLCLLQRLRLIRSSKHQQDGEAAAGSRKGSTANSLKGFYSLENGGGRPGIKDEESGNKPGVEVSQPEDEEDEDGYFNPMRMPGENELNVIKHQEMFLFL